VFPHESSALVEIDTEMETNVLDCKTYLMHWQHLEICSWTVDFSTCKTTVTDCTVILYQDKGNCYVCEKYAQNAYHNE